MSLVTFLTRNTNAGQLAPRCMVAEGNAAQFREGQRVRSERCPLGPAGWCPGILDACKILCPGRVMIPTPRGRRRGFQ